MAGLEGGYPLTRGPSHSDFLPSAHPGRALTPVRWGLVGPGRIAGQFAKAMGVASGSSLEAVAGRSRSRAERFAREHGVPNCFDSYRALLDDPSIDAVYIATPHRYHYSIARDCLLAGKPVLCEKPLAVNVREAAELIDLSQRTGVFLMEALWTRFLPIYEQVNEWLASYTIGSVHAIVSSFGFEFPRDPQDRMLNPDLAGGALLDMGVYNLAMSQWVYGEAPLSYSIEGHVGETGVDEHNQTVLRYSQGRSCKFSNSMTRQLQNDMIIHGSTGCIRIHANFWTATSATLSVGENGNSREQPTSITRGFRATGLEYEIEAAAHCIRNGLHECSAMPHASTLQTMRLLDGLRGKMGLSYAFEQRSGKDG